MPCSSSCTLKPSPELSHTQGLIEVSAGIMAKQGVRSEIIRAVDHDIATWVWPDMTEHGAAAVCWWRESVPPCPWCRGPGRVWPGPRVCAGSALVVVAAG